jgi:hypothetical protein
MMDDIDYGEGAYYLDEENRVDNNNEHPTDVLLEELEEVD